jgi:hypothetical protein
MVAFSTTLRVLNPFNEGAAEAGLGINDEQRARITVLSLGNNLARAVKKGREFQLPDEMSWDRIGNRIWTGYQRSTGFDQTNTGGDPG